MLYVYFFNATYIYIYIYIYIYAELNWSGAIFSKRIIKDSGVLGHLEVWGNFSHKKNDKNSGVWGNFVL